MSTLVYVLVTVFSTVPSYNSAALVQYQLSELWRQRTRVDVHLFPTLSSSVYPSFAGFPYDNGVGRVHMTSDDVKKFAADLNDTEISSVCSYVYLGSTFYVVNTVPSTDDEVEVSLNLTLMELEAMTDEMITRSMKPSHICRGSDGLHQVVWRGGPKKYLRHYIVQESEIKAILREDIKYGQHGYYPISLQVYHSGNQTTALIVWEKGYGVRYRIQSGTVLSVMDDEMADTRMKPSIICGLPGRRTRSPTKYFVVWRSEEFSWEGREIPRTAVAQPIRIDTTKLDEVVEKEMRFSKMPSLTISVFRRGQSVLSVSYGFSDLRTERRATPRNSYRIASISKTITAMGIAELINRRHINMDSKVFGMGGILSWLDVTRAHPWLRILTVRHLLEHTSGGWSNHDKLEFNATPLTERLNGTELLRFFIRSYEPKYQPGRRYMYSNIAYIFLGKVIEQITSTTYSDFIQDVILKPNKIEAQMGDVEPSSSEVSYYSLDNANPYTYWSPSKLDAAAGWVMRAEEVARLFMLLETQKYQWYRLLVQPSDIRRNYGRGVQLGDDGSLYHTGSLAGSEGIGYSGRDTQVAILTNIRGREHAQHTAWMERLCRLFATHDLLP